MQLEQEFKKNIQDYVVVALIVFPLAVHCDGVIGNYELPKHASYELACRKIRTKKCAILTKRLAERRAPSQRLTGTHSLYE